MIYFFERACIPVHQRIGRKERRSRTMFASNILSDNSVFIFSCLSIAIIAVLIIPFVILLTSSPMVEIRRFEEEKYFVDEEATLQPFPSVRDAPTLALSVIVPAYNEEVRLPPMLDETLTFLLGRQSVNSTFTYEIIIVNDGSTDKTSSVAASYVRKYGSDIVRVLNLKVNRGKGGAVRLGMLSARGSVLLFADADGATTFDDIVKLEAELVNTIGVDYVKSPAKVAESLAIVCGSRAHLEEEAIASRSLFRTVLMYGFHFMVRMFATGSVKDTQCGFKLFTREAAIQCFYNVHVERWAFDVELFYLAERFRIPVAEVSVNWTEIEGSKIIPVFSWLAMALDLFMIWFKYFTGAWDAALVHK